MRATRDSVALVGRASTQAIAERALALVAATVKGAVNALQVPPAGPDRQVLLRVRFAEVNRSVTSEFGLNLLLDGRGGNARSDLDGAVPVAAFDDDRRSADAAHSFSLSDILNIFAFRPDLNLGSHDSGFAGARAAADSGGAEPGRDQWKRGELPGRRRVPGADRAVGRCDAGAVTVQFREFGIRLSFLPQITSNGTIKLHVKPEVSTIDPANGVTVSGFRIPALSTRRIETDVELAEGRAS